VQAVPAPAPETCTNAIDKRFARLGRPGAQCKSAP
jgi:hypothetical protein